MIYAGASDLNPMAYPSGTWTIPAQPSPYNTFDLIFSRNTTAPEILVRTDKWHLTLSTYPNVAAPTLTPTRTSTPTLTPTSTATSTLTVTSTSMATSNGSGTCWRAGPRWVDDAVYYEIDTSDIPSYITEVDWIAAIEFAAETWNNVLPSNFRFINLPGSGNVISYEEPDGALWLAGTNAYSPGGPYSTAYTHINPYYTWDTNIAPSQGIQVAMVKLPTIFKM